MKEEGENEIDIEVWEREKQHSGPRDVEINFQFLNHKNFESMVSIP